MPRVLGLVLGLLVVASPVTAQSPAPSSASTPSVIRDAVTGLAALDAFEYRSTQVVGTDTSFVSDMVVRRTPVPSVRLRVTGDGEVLHETIAIDRQAWSRSNGGRWTADGEHDTGMQLAVGIWPIEPRLLFDLVRAGIEMQPSGAVDLDGRATLRFRGELDDVPSTDLSGTLDLLVDADRGFLIRAEADVLDRGVRAVARSVDSVRLHEVIEVTRVDDPELRIDPPDVPAGPTSSLDGDLGPVPASPEVEP